MVALLHHFVPVVLNLNDSVAVAVYCDHANIHDTIEVVVIEAYGLVAMTMAMMLILILYVDLVIG